MELRNSSESLLVHEFKSLYVGKEKCNFFPPSSHLSPYEQLEKHI